MKNIMLFVLLPIFVHASVCLGQESKWVKKADMPTARYPATSAVNGKIYAIGASSEIGLVEEYDPATDTWTRKADMPTIRGGLSTSVVNGKIYAIGGNRGGTHYAVVEEYDPVTDTWKRRADMPTERRGLSTSVVNGKIYAIGGYHRGGIGLGESLVAEYDPITNTWDTKADMPTGRSRFSSSAVNGKIYAIGGSVWPNPLLSTVEEYDPATDTWTRKADMPTARDSLATCVVDGKIYVIGGASNDEQFLSTVEVYDPTTDIWTLNAEKMPTGRFGLSTSVVDGRIYAIGGQPGPWPSLTGATEEYQPLPWGFARAPNPAESTRYPDTWMTLTWEPGDFAVSHDVYLGNSFEDVNDGLDETFRGNQTATFFGHSYPNGLVRGTTYFWRIDEVNDAELNSPWKGSVWSFMIAPKIAYNPTPDDGTEFVELDVELSWAAGLEAVFHTVYFGDNFDDVNNATGNQQQVKTIHTPGPLEFGKTYYWRVDEFTGGRGSEKHKGEIWSFTTEGAAENPKPSNDVTTVEMNVTLNWTSAEHTALHEVYFGTDKEAVRNANVDSPEYKGTQIPGVESYEPGILSPDITYYWRVDEVNSVHPDSPWHGSVWSFTTGDYFVIDDFEDYDIYNKIWWAWQDGIGYADHPSEPSYSGNGTGSMLGDERTGTTAGDFRIHGGRQSMPYWYDNDYPDLLKYSEATRTVTSPSDWTEHGVNTLSIWCISDWDWDRNISANDAEPMYVILNDSAVVSHDDSEITQIYNWTEWRIDLQEFTNLGIDLANVHTIGIGFGDRDNPQPGGKGLMSFDDIRLLRLP